MGLAGEQAEHAGGIGCVLWFSEDLFVDDDYGVRAENEGVRRDGVSSGDGLGLFTGETGDEANRVFAGLAEFGDIGGNDLESEAGLREKFAAARRGGGQNQWGPAAFDISPGHALIPTCTPR